jgi:hypothetical protein
MVRAIWKFGKLDSNGDCVTRISKIALNLEAFVDNTAHIAMAVDRVSLNRLEWFCMDVLPFQLPFLAACKTLHIRLFG